MTVLTKKHAAKADFLNLLQIANELFVLFVLFRNFPATGSKFVMIGLIDERPPLVLSYTKLIRS